MASADLKIPQEKLPACLLPVFCASYRAPKMANLGLNFRPKLGPCATTIRAAHLRFQQFKNAKGPSSYIPVISDTLLGPDTPMTAPETSNPSQMRGETSKFEQDLAIKIAPSLEYWKSKNPNWGFSTCSNLSDEPKCTELPKTLQKHALIRTWVFCGNIIPNLT